MTDSSANGETGFKADIGVSIPGTLRFATVSVEAQSVPLRKNAEGMSGTLKDGTVIPPTVEILYWLKGGHNAAYQLQVSLQRPEWAKKRVWKGPASHLTEGSVKDTVSVPLADFKEE